MGVQFVTGKGDAVDAYFSISVPTHANQRLALEDLADLERQPDRLFRQDVLAEFMGRDGAVFSNFDEYLKAFGLTIGLFVVSGIASLVWGTILGGSARGQRR